MIKIAINGIGKVGKSLINLLRKTDEEIRVVYIGRRNFQWISKEGINIKELPSFEKIYFEYVEKHDIENIIKTCDIDAWFEMTPTDLKEAESIYKKMHTILSHGISVVLANKSPVLYNYMELKNIADKSGAYLGLSAVMGASLPSFAIGYYGTLGSEIISMEAILNGTSNYILELMEKGNSFHESIESAIEIGIAEPNWQYDVDGIDSAVKMTILSSVIKGKNIKLDMSKVKGLRNLSEEELRTSFEIGERYKLVAKFENDEVSVLPKKFNKDDLFYQVNGSNKILRIQTTTLSEMTVIGGKSGLAEVAASMYRDLCWIKEQK